MLKCSPKWMDSNSLMSDFHVRHLVAAVYTHRDANCWSVMVMVESAGHWPSPVDVMCLWSPLTRYLALILFNIATYPALISLWGPCMGRFWWNAFSVTSALLRRTDMNHHPARDRQSTNSQYRTQVSPFSHVSSYREESQHNMYLWPICV